MSSPSGTPCTVQLVCGGKCICNDDPKHPHTIHVCSREGCPCHKEAYKVDLVHDKSGREYYVPQGARLVRKGKGAQP